MRVSLSSLLAYAKNKLSPNRFKALRRKLTGASGERGRARMGGRVLRRRATVAVRRKSAAQARRRTERVSRRVNRARA